MSSRAATPSSRPPQGEQFVLSLSCPDDVGVVAAVAGQLVAYQAIMRESEQFEDVDTGRFFMRVLFTRTDGPMDIGGLRAAFAVAAERYSMTWHLSDLATPTRTMIMVSKIGHCLHDLLYRHRSGVLNIDPVAIVSNHPTCAETAAEAGIPFHHIPVSADRRARAEAELMHLHRHYDAELVVLARYMQILSDGVCSQLRGAAINIHHSFLPGFVGAKPYHQAHVRGVKLIGATAHYVTADLDEGPIIEQDVERVHHAYTAADLELAGRDVEARVLARAVKWHTEHRVFLNGSRTVVLR